MTVEMAVWTSLFLGGVLGTFLMRRSGDVGIWLMRKFKFGWASNPALTFHSAPSWFGNRGEAPTGDPPKEPAEKTVTMTQKEMDFVVESRLKREREKFADYDDLKKFKTEREKQEDLKNQKELEDAKKYDDAKKGYETQIGQHKELITKKDQEIVDLRIIHALTNEISKQNGYTEETIALLRANTVLDAAGNVIIKGKDANNIDTQLPASEGVKKFLEARPYLVKSTHRPGGGTPPGTPPAGNEGAAQDHNALNKGYAEAITRGDFKAAKEFKTKLNQTMAAKGVSV